MAIICFQDADYVFYLFDVCAELNAWMFRDSESLNVLPVTSVDLPQQHRKENVALGLQNSVVFVVY